jgi:MFS family permease
MIGDVSLFNLLLPVLIAGAIASRGFRVDDDYVASWASWFNLPLDEKTRPIVRRYLKLSRRCRTAGGLVGYLSPTIYLEIVAPGAQPDDVGGWAVTLMIVGYLLGALLAEVLIDPPGRRSGNMLVVPARLSDYLPTYATVLVRALAIASVLLAALYAISQPNGRSIDLPSVTQVAALGIAAPCVAAVVEALQRRILRRTQPIGPLTDTAVDTAVKRSSLQILSGGGIALLAGIAGPMLVLTLIAFTTESLPPWLGFLAFALVSLPPLYFWLYFGKPGGFGMRRHDRQGATT